MHLLSIHVEIKFLPEILLNDCPIESFDTDDVKNCIYQPPPLNTQTHTGQLLGVKLFSLFLLLYIRLSWKQHLFNDAEVNNPLRE